MDTFLSHALLVFVFSMLGTAYLVPKIISIIKYKKLMDNPNSRSSHSKATPSLGGIAFFLILVVSMYFINGYDTYGVATSYYPALSILLFLGLKDDLVVLSPSTKLLGQVIACLFIVANSKFQLVDLHGFLGIHDIPVWLGYTIALLLMLAIINAFNFIDGIDGLAASVGIVAFLSFAAIFCMAERYFMCLTCITLVGILVGFLFFNLSKRNKIFMGDTGSMLLGFMLGVMSVRFLSLDQESINRIPFNAVDIPVVILAFLIVPLFDTTRVFAIRILQGKNIFTPDRNHLHHVLIDGLRISHRRASFYIAIANIIAVVFFAAVLKLTNLYVAFSIILFAAFSTCFYLSQLRKNKVNANQKGALISPISKSKTAKQH